MSLRSGRDKLLSNSKSFMSSSELPFHWLSTKVSPRNLSFSSQRTVTCSPETQSSLKRCPNFKSRRDQFNSKLMKADRSRTKKTDWLVSSDPSESDLRDTMHSSPERIDFLKEWPEVYSREKSQFSKLSTHLMEMVTDSLTDMSSSKLSIKWSCTIYQLKTRMIWSTP